MKTPTPILPLVILLLYGVNCFSQSSLYSESHKEKELSYGVIANDDLNIISEIEKIKYEFRYSERSYTKVIDANYQTTLDITIDSNGFEQEWMHLAKRFHYDKDGISYYDKQNVLLNVIAYTEEQQTRNQELSQDIQTYGYHPGISSFPKIDVETKTAFEDAGVAVSIDNDSTLMSLVYSGGEKETYDLMNSSLTREWIDEDGLKNREILNYEPYEDNKGFLLVSRKHERFLQSENGPCITAVRLIYYSNYEITDVAKLIDKATDQYRAINIYPNPNSGIFSVQVILPEGETITGTQITNVLTGETIIQNPDKAKSFSVDIQDHVPGHYVIQVTTTQSSLSSHFFKQ